MKDTVEVVVSWPANSSVITSSRTWRSLSDVPSSSLRVQQQAQHVLAALARRAPARDLAVDHAVQAPRRALQARPRGERATQEARGVFRRVERQRLLEESRRVGPARGLAVGVQAEQRAHRDPHRQLPRPVVEVDPPIPRRAAARRELLQRAIRLL